MANYIEVKVTYMKTLENGSQKNESELYLVDALSITEAEARVMKELAPFDLDGMEVTAVKKSPVSDVIFNSATTADKFYLAKVGIVTINESTGAEKLSNYSHLIQASNFSAALDVLIDNYKGTMMDYKILSVAETKILDVYRHE